MCIVFLCRNIGDVPSTLYSRLSPDQQLTAETNLRYEVPNSQSSKTHCNLVLQDNGDVTSPVVNISMNFAIPAIIGVPSVPVPPTILACKMKLRIKLFLLNQWTYISLLLFYLSKGK
jgi:hypothetical protein|uniref:Uncharacterized protein n=1 Tax=Zea mays TaxID=4577 RepID=A0A804NX80_MAIZE